MEQPPQSFYGPTRLSLAFRKTNQLRFTSAQGLAPSLRGFGQAVSDTSFETDASRFTRPGGPVAGASPIDANESRPGRVGSPTGIEGCLLIRLHYTSGNIPGGSPVPAELLCLLCFVVPGRASGLASCMGFVCLSFASIEAHLFTPSRIPLVAPGPPSRP